MKRKDYVKILHACILFIFCFYSFCFFTTIYAAEIKNIGGIKVEVKNENGENIIGAKVYVCEISECFETGKNGQTTNILVPVTPDNRFIEICKKDFGEVTLLITKDGYCTTCVTEVIVRSGVTRLGPKVILKVGNEVDYKHVTDEIDQSWLKRICDKYAKD